MISMGPLVRRYDHSLLNHPLHMAVDFGAFGFVANLWLLGAFVFPPIRAVVPAVRGAELATPRSIQRRSGVSRARGRRWFCRSGPPNGCTTRRSASPAFTLLALAAAPIAPAEDTRRRGVTVWSTLALPMGHALMFVLGV